MAQSTPSQSSVSSDAFEALIDLLATNGIDEHPTTLPGARTRVQSNVTLRDDSGRLDFDKIRLMFAGQPNNPLESHMVESFADDAPRSMRRSEEGDTDDEPPPTHRSTPVPSPPISSPPPPPGNQGTTICHRRSSTFGNQPLVTVVDNRRDANEDVSDQPLSFDELNTALTNAHSEVKSLRQQYDELNALVSKHFGSQAKEKHQAGPSGVDTQVRRADHDSSPEKQYSEGELIQPHHSEETPSSLSSDVPPEIGNLTESEAKRALAALTRTFNLSPAIIGPLVAIPPSTSSLPYQQHSPAHFQGQQHDLDTLGRAVKFVKTVDELVWRRSVTPSCPRTLQPVFSEDNIAALVSRLELWERAVRRSSRI